MGCRTSPELRHVAYTRVRLFGEVVKLVSLPKIECEFNNVPLMSRKNVGRIERPHSYLKGQVAVGIIHSGQSFNLLTESVFCPDTTEAVYAKTKAILALRDILPKLLGPVRKGGKRYLL